MAVLNTDATVDARLESVPGQMQGLDSIRLASFDAHEHLVRSRNAGCKKQHLKMEKDGGAQRKILGTGLVKLSYGLFCAQTCDGPWDMTFLDQNSSRRFNSGREKNM